MKFSVASRDLKEALTLVTPAMSSTSDLTGHYLFRKAKADGRVEVLSAHGRLGAGCSFVADLQEEGNSFTMMGPAFRELVKLMSDDIVLELSHDPETKKTKVYEAGAEKNHSTFLSLNPDHFPYWDSVLSASKKVATVESDRLVQALNCAKVFASQDENSPMCVCEVRDGILMATNKMAAAMITIPGMEESSLRLHVKDVPSVVNFLSNVGDEIMLMEHDRCLFFQRGDGAFFGASRFRVPFPKLAKPGDMEQEWWEFNRDRAVLAMRKLRSNSPKEGVRLKVTRPADGNPIVLQQTNHAGGLDTQNITTSDVGRGDGFEDLPETFEVGSTDYLNVLEALESPTVKVGANVHRKIGYLRAVETRNADENGDGGDEYLFMIAWMR